MNTSTSTITMNRDQLDALLCVVFGRIVRHIREQRNQTVTPFALLLGIPTEELEWVEDGTDSSISVFYRISAATGVSCARLGAAVQLTAMNLVDNPDVIKAITRKDRDWDTLDKLVVAELDVVADLLKLPVHNAIHGVPPGTNKPLPGAAPSPAPAPAPAKMRPLTVIEGHQDENEPDLDLDDNLDADDEDAETEAKTTTTAAPPARINTTSFFSSAATQANVPVVNITRGAGPKHPDVQRRKPGRPRKYPLPANE